MNKDGYDEYLCPKCALSFVYPQPDAEWLRDEVYSLESGYQANKTADLSIEKEGKRYGRVLDFMAKKKPYGKMLDVGCSSGQVMYWAKKRGLECAGVEINKRTADLAAQNGFEVFNGFLEDANYKKKSFDLIFMGDVLEHVNDPRKFIETAKSFLKTDGLMVISTPNVDCFWSRITLLLYKWFRIPWTSATPPYHLSQFSFSNLNMLMSEFDMKCMRAFFLPPPSLKYELGSLHLLKRYKKSRSISDLLYMIFAFIFYAKVYILNLLAHPFLKKDFQMTVVYSSSK